MNTVFFSVGFCIQTATEEIFLKRAIVICIRAYSIIIIIIIINLGASFPDLGVCFYHHFNIGASFHRYRGFFIIISISEHRFTGIGAFYNSFDVVLSPIVNFNFFLQYKLELLRFLLEQFCDVLKLTRKYHEIA